MGLIAGAIVPHPPVLLPEIGGSRLKELELTKNALNQLKTALSAAELLIFSSPHTAMLANAFTVNATPVLKSNFNSFGFPHLTLSLPGNTEVATQILNALFQAGVHVEPTYATEIDWGVSVPYSYIGEKKPVISTSISSLPLKYHYLFGQALAVIINKLSLPVAFIASGDLSHRLAPTGPYGFSQQGVVFDKLVKNIFASGHLEDILSIDLALASEAGECGLRPLTVLAGLFSENLKITTQLLSYEAPFGIGYLVGLIKPVGVSSNA